MPTVRSTLTIGSRAAATREPRQVRKEAAINAARRVPRNGLVRADRTYGHAGVSGRRRVHGKSIIPGMFTMAVGHSDDVDPARAIEEAISQCREQLELHAGGARPSAALLFCTLDSFDAELVTRVREAFGQIE